MFGARASLNRRRSMKQCCKEVRGEGRRETIFCERQGKSAKTRLQGGTGKGSAGKAEKRKGDATERLGAPKTFLVTRIIAAAIGVRIILVDGEKTSISQMEGRLAVLVR